MDPTAISGSSCLATRISLPGQGKGQQSPARLGALQQGEWCRCSQPLPLQAIRYSSQQDPMGMCGSPIQTEA